MSQQASVPHARSVEVTTEVEPDTDQFISSVPTRVAGLSTQHIVHSRRDAQPQCNCSTICVQEGAVATGSEKRTPSTAILPSNSACYPGCNGLCDSVIEALDCDTVPHFLAPTQLSNLLLSLGAWSSGMILHSGWSGPEFDSRCPPTPGCMPVVIYF